MMECPLPGPLDCHVAAMTGERTNEALDLREGKVEGFAVLVM